MTNEPEFELFLDIDYTLTNIFDCWQRAFVEPMASLMGITPEEAEAAGRNIWESGTAYSLERHCQALGVTSLPGAGAIVEAFKARVASGEGVYPDVKPFIEKWIERVPISILTFGAEEYQSLKLLGIGIPLDAYERLMFMDRPDAKGASIEALSDRVGEAVFIDDNRHEHQAARRQCTHLFGIQMIRHAWVPRARRVDETVFSLESVDLCLEQRYCR